ncbi:MAG: hypothetical protein ACI4EU_05115 [Butyrivibrio sp.]
MIEIFYPADPCVGCDKRKSAVCSCPKSVAYLREVLAAAKRECELIRRPDWNEIRSEVRIIEAGKETPTETVKPGGVMAPAKRRMTAAEKNERRNEILKILGGK